MRMKHRYDHWSQVSEYSPGAKIWFFNPRRTKGRCPKLTSPRQGPGVVLAQISDVVIKIKMGPRAFPRIVHADRLRPYKGDLMPSWLSCRSSRSWNYRSRRGARLAEPCCEYTSPGQGVGDPLA